MADRIASSTSPASAEKGAAGRSRPMTGARANAVAKAPAKRSGTKPATPTSAKTSATRKPAAPAATAKPAAKKAATAKPAAARSTAKPAASKAPAKASKTQQAKATGRTTAKAAPARTTKTAAKAAKAAPATRAGGAAKPKSPAAKSASATKKAPARGQRLVVREDESPWTAAELADVRTQLDAERLRLREQISDVEEGIADLLRDSGDGAGDDQADAGTKTFEREHEMQLANNARELIEQNRRALQRLTDGTYGVCESCGRPIGKLRLQAFPRATLCVSCKQLEERH